MNGNLLKREKSCESFISEKICGESEQKVAIGPLKRSSDDLSNFQEYKALSENNGRDNYLKLAHKEEQIIKSRPNSKDLKIAFSSYAYDGNYLYKPILMNWQKGEDSFANLDVKRKYDAILMNRYINGREGLPQELTVYFGVCLDEINCFLKECGLNIIKMARRGNNLKTIIREYFSANNGLISEVCEGNAFCSTSTDLQKAAGFSRDFGTNLVIQLKLPVGTKALAIDAMPLDLKIGDIHRVSDDNSILFESKAEEEDIFRQQTGEPFDDRIIHDCLDQSEILLPIKTKFKFKNINLQREIIIMEAEVIPN